MSNFIELNRIPQITDVAGAYMVNNPDNSLDNGLYVKNTNTDYPNKISLNTTQSYSKGTTIIDKELTCDMTTGTFTMVDHGLVNKEVIEFSSETGILPYNSDNIGGTWYFIINVIGDTFQISTNYSGTAIIPTSNGTIGYKIKKFFRNIDLDISNRLKTINSKMQIVLYIESINIANIISSSGISINLENNKTYDNKSTLVIGTAPAAPPKLIKNYITLNFIKLSNDTISINGNAIGTSTNDKVVISTNSANIINTIVNIINLNNLNIIPENTVITDPTLYKQFFRSMTAIIN